MKKHILVTGGAGFIGTHLTDALISRGYKVTILDKKVTKERHFIHPDAGILTVDLTSPNAMQLVKALEPDMIIHLAANANVAKSVADPVYDAQINYLATIRLLDTAKDISVKRFVFMSTGGAMSSEATILPTPENRIAEPLSPYAKHKLASEKMVSFYTEIHKLPSVTLRPSNVYGPRQSPTTGEANAVATFATRMLNAATTKINGSGLVTRDYVYIDDVVRAAILALEMPNISGAFNVGSGTETSINDLHARIAKLTEYATAPVHGPAAKGEPQRSCLDINKMRHILRWSPVISLDEGLKRTIKWYKNERMSVLNKQKVCIELDNG